MSKEHQFIIDARLREIKNDFMNTDVAIMNEDVGIEMDEETIIGYYEEIHVMVTNYARLHHESDSDHYYSRASALESHDPSLKW
jgi:hypothetical protein